MDYGAHKVTTFACFFCTALNSLTNYSAAMKSVIQKFLYMCTSTITVLIGCCRILFYTSPKWSKSCDFDSLMLLPATFHEPAQLWTIDPSLLLVHTCGTIYHFISVTLNYRFSSFAGYWKRICLAEDHGA